jgi:endogenous inhibitor of DNA gyrase (YacG/DUF329 family)
MKQNHLPYCYFIGWSKEGKYYYGVKYGRDANPSTFWSKYFTSSKYVKLMRERHGEPDVIKVRKTFKSAEEAVCWEEKVIRRMNLANRDEWLNRNNTSTSTKGIVNVPKTQAQKDHHSNVMTGKKHTQDTKDKIAEGLRNYKRTKEHQERLNAALTGIKKPSLMNGKETPCPTCGNMVYRTNYQLKNDYHKYCSKECGKVGKAWRKGIKGHHS